MKLLRTALSPLISEPVVGRRILVRLTVVACLIITISSCTVIPNADYDFMGRFSMGTPRTIIDSVKNEDPYFSYDVRLQGMESPVHVDLYRMVITNVSRDFLSMVGLRPQKMHYDYIGFAYREDRLVYSGTPDDFKKATNSEIAAVGLAVADSLRKEY
ncbi:MAG: hypothetical protein ACKOAX_06810 [Candidatus Kapaibacterium sp.]